MKHLDLFTGIGGFALAASQVWPDHELVQCVEIDPFCHKVIHKHWPNVPIHRDIRTFNGVKYAGTIDLLTGGFPCQDISAATPAPAGIHGERSGLWFEMCRVISEARPRFVIVENSPELLNRGFGNFLASLAKIGYDAEWHCLSASRVGAPHNRDRVWIVAYPASLRRNGRGISLSWGKHVQFAGLDCAETWSQDLYTPQFCRASDGIPDRSHRVSALGNAIVPAVAEVIMRAIKAVDEEVFA